jgi:hypothetical protein
VVVALVLLGTAGAYHSQHLLTDRDPGVYLNTGRSIARTHVLHPTVARSPFDDDTMYTSQESGFAIVNHHLYSNFLNFLPSLMALGWSAGGDAGLLLVPAILGALALLALYALGTLIVGPRWALLGPVVLRSRRCNRGSHATRTPSSRSKSSRWAGGGSSWRRVAARVRSRVRSRASCSAR